MIFSFFKKKKSVDLPKLKVDLHSHLIPGIDDGAQTMAESISLLKKLELLGYEKVITTPHIMVDVYRNNTNIIKDGLEKLRVEAKKEGIKLHIEAAAEYYLDEGFLEHLKSEDVLSIDGKYILFETSYVSKPMNLEEMIFAISTAGYTPLLAHPERYRYIKDPKTEYARFKELGVEFQVNLNSLLGHYGKSAQKNALFLSKAGYIDFLGSDTHNERHLETLESVLVSKEYINVFENNKIKNHTLYENKEEIWN